MPAPAPDRRDALLAVGLAALTVAVFHAVPTFGFLNFDDDVYVTANPVVRGGWSAAAVRWAFTNTGSGHFHPLTWLSHLADVTWFGLTPGPHHAVTLALHTLAATLCFAAWRALLVGHAHGRWLAFMGAAVFAVHPLRLESVAWVATRKDVLSGVLFFAALWAFARLEGRARLPVVMGLYLLALLAKPTVLPLPLLLPLLEAWPLGAARRTSWAQKAPLLGLMAAFAAVAVYAQRSAGALATLDQVPLASRLPNAAVGVWAQVGHLVWPAGQSLFHPLRPLVPGLGVAAGLLLAGVAWAGVTRRLPLPGAVGLAWSALLLLPVSGLVQIGAQAVADRWMYLPTSGLVVGTLACLPAGLSRAQRWGWGGAWVAALAVVTVLSAGAWRDSEAVFAHALEVEPENFMAHNNLGLALEGRGDWAGAEQHYEESVRLNPTWPTALSNLASARGRRGLYAEAEALCQRALARQPDHQPAHYNLALTLALQGRPLDALPHYERAVALAAGDGQAALGLGATLVTLGRAAEGAEALRRAVALQPDSAEALAHLGRALRLAGDGAGARDAVSRALALEPAQPVARAEAALLGLP